MDDKILSVQYRTRQVDVGLWGDDRKIRLADGGGGRGGCVLGRVFLIELSLAQIVICTVAVGVFGLACVKQHGGEKTLRTMPTRRKSHSRKN
jgi:hypothetical protein